MGTTADEGKSCVSFILATFNRCQVVLHTLERVLRCGLERQQFEVIVIDNASSDGTAAEIGRRFPSVTVLRQPVNLGPCAKNAGVAIARGEFVVFLDDDSFPQPGAIARMLEHFARDEALGAAVFTITLPDGSQECSAYPNVCIGCGTGFRRRALVDAGGLPTDFFMAAEEYDLSLRLLGAGWSIERFDDLHVTHLKTPASRFPARIVRLDARNNTLLALRHFPAPWRWRYALEWLERYRLMAIANRRLLPFWGGAIEGLARGAITMHRPMRPDAFERFARIDETCQRLADAKRRFGWKRILLVDLGKNILAYRLAAEAAGLQIVAIADARLGGRNLRFRGYPLLSDEQSMRSDFDAVVIANLSPVHAAERLRHWRSIQSRPVIDLFETGAVPDRESAAA